jgi:hypothetical protein
MASEGSVQLTDSGAIKQFHIFGSGDIVQHVARNPQHWLSAPPTRLQLLNHRDRQRPRLSPSNRTRTLCSERYHVLQTRGYEVLRHRHPRGKAYGSAEHFIRPKGSEWPAHNQRRQHRWVWHSQLHTSKISIYATRPPKTGWVIEADGAARAAIYALHKSGVEKMFISNRTRSRAEAIASKFADQFHVEVVDDWEEMNSHPADIVVGTIPVETISDTHFGKV